MVSREQSDGHAREEREPHGDDAGLHRRARPVDDAAQHIPAQLVGAEPVSERGSGEDSGLLGLIGIVGSDHVRAQSDEEDESDDHQPEARPTGLECPGQDRAEPAHDRPPATRSECADR